MSRHTLEMMKPESAGVIEDCIEDAHQQRVEGEKGVIGHLCPVDGYEVPVLGDVDVVDGIPHFPDTQELGRHAELHVRDMLVGDEPYDREHGPGGHEKGQRIGEPCRHLFKSGRALQLFCSLCCH